MQCCAARGAALLSRDSGSALTASVMGRRHACGGFCGLDGQPDLYYTFFALLTLDALSQLPGAGALSSSAADDSVGAAADRGSAQLGEWLRSVYPASRGVDRTCAELMLLQSGNISRLKVRCALAKSILLSAPSDSYKLFLSGFLMERLLPARLNRLLIRGAAALLLKRDGALDFSALGTPGGVVRLLLAAECGDTAVAGRMRTLLGQRHKASGGYSAAPGAPADLLSTAAALFAGSHCRERRFGREEERRRDADGASIALDRAFVEMCWQEDGLFSAAPDQRDGDLEHTYYGLLALGCLY